MPTTAINHRAESADDKFARLLTSAAWRKPSLFKVAVGPPVLPDTVSDHESPLRIFANRMAERFCAPAASLIHISLQPPHALSETADVNPAVCAAALKNSTDGQWLGLDLRIPWGAGHKAILPLHAFFKPAAGQSVSDLKKQWLQEQSPAWRFAAAIAAAARCLPWRSLENLAEDLGKPLKNECMLLTQLALCGRGILRHEELSLRACEHLPQLVAAVSEQAAMEILPPICDVLSRRPEFPNTAADLVKVLLDKSPEAEGDSAFNRERFISQLAAQGAGGMRANQAGHVVAFFDRRRWSFGLSTAVRDLAGGRTLTGGAEDSLVAEIEISLKRAMVRGLLSQTLREPALEHIKSALSDSSREKVRKTIAGLLANMLPLADPGQWTAHQTLEPFFQTWEAADALVTLPGRLETVAWSESLPHFSSEPPLRYPASFISWLRGWFSDQEKPSPAQSFSCAKDLLTLQLEFAARGAPQAATMPEFFNKLGLGLPQPQLRHHALLTALEILENRTDSPLEQFLKWIDPHCDKNLLSATSAMVELTPWAVPPLHGLWRIWFLQAWELQPTEHAATFLSVVVAGRLRSGDPVWHSALNQPYLNGCKNNLFALAAAQDTILFFRAENADRQADIIGFIEEFTRWCGCKDRFDKLLELAAAAGTLLSPGDKARLLLQALPSGTASLPFLLATYLFEDDSFAHQIASEPKLCSALTCLLQPSPQRTTIAGLLVEHLISGDGSAAARWSAVLALLHAFSREASQLGPHAFRRLAPELLPELIQAGTAHLPSAGEFSLVLAAKPIAPALALTVVEKVFSTPEVSFDRHALTVRTLVEVFRTLELGAESDRKIALQLLDHKDLPLAPVRRLHLLLLAIPSARGIASDLAWQEASRLRQSNAAASVAFARLSVQLAQAK